MTYDWRIRGALHHGSTTVNTNLMAVYIDEETSADFANGVLGERINFPFPRSVYGRVVRELKTEGATGVGFDIIFDQLRASDPKVVETNNGQIDVISSDAFFARQLRNASNAVLAIGVNETPGVNEPQVLYPNDFFLTNAAAGDISAPSDADGVLRRIEPYVKNASSKPRWHMAVVLAAQALHLEMDHPEFRKGEIILRGPNGVERHLPLDAEGKMLVNWRIHWSRIDSASLVNLYHMDLLRRAPASDLEAAVKLERYFEKFRTNGYASASGRNPFKDKIVFVGSTMVGNNLTDRGATPFDEKDYLVSMHWNVANSIIENQFIQRTPFWLDFLVIVALGLLSGLMTWRLGTFSSVSLVLLCMAAFAGLAWLIFMQFTLWVPIVLPVLGSLFLTHIAMVSYRVVVEQNERRRVRAVFSKIVAPEVVNTLLASEKLALGGARRQITVFFADVRGFTEMCDTVQARAEEFVRDAKLAPEQAEAYYDRAASETLETVNLYLGAIADTIKKHEGTLDKYIGDCVMAFWGAPVHNEKHALYCVRAALDSQRALYSLNQVRVAENKKREQENPARVAAGELSLSMLPILSLGSGINTGTVIVGLMGSDAHILNYTVFGREVNMASRLESLSGRGRVIIGEATYNDLKRDDPALAATCVEQPPTMLKGFRTAIRNYEVPWKEAAPTPPTPASQPATA